MRGPARCLSRKHGATCQGSGAGAGSVPGPVHFCRPARQGPACRRGRPAGYTDRRPCRCYIRRRRRAEGPHGSAGPLSLPPRGRPITRPALLQTVARPPHRDNGARRHPSIPVPVTLRRPGHFDELDRHGRGAHRIGNDGRFAFTGAPADGRYSLRCLARCLTREATGRRGNVLAHAGRFASLGCDCKGFLRRGHCKERDCLAALLRRGLVKPAAV
jgi:hypothetical protein